jgi:D-galacturonate reductase
LASDAAGYSSLNPLFMKYTPDADGFFSGQMGYGYRSIELFIRAADEIRQGRSQPEEFRGKLATAQETLLVTAILEAGRKSLDTDGREVKIRYGNDPYDISL